MFKKHAVKGFKWSAIDSLSSQIINFVIGVILARLLTPDDFGLIGMIMIFIAVSQVLVNSGINDALIRRQEVTQNYYNTAFIFNTAVSILLYLVLFSTASYIAEFYKKPELTDIIRVIGITIILNAFTLVQKAKITKQIDFKSLTKVNLIASLISGIIGITLAYLDFGVWSLVWRTVLLSIMTLLIFSILTKWVPSLNFSKSAFKDLFGFGSRLMVLGIIDTIYQNVYFLIIGKYFSAAQLGQYTRAETFKRLPSQGITQIVQRVSFPLLAGIQENKAQLRENYRRLIKSVMLVSISAMFILAAIAQDLTIVLLGPEWAEAGIYLQILCFSAIFYPLDALNANILKIMNRSDLILKVGIWRKIIAIPVIAVLVFNGIIPFLFTLILHQLISFFLISNYSKHYINYGTSDQIKDLYPVLLIMTTIFIILSLVYFNWNIDPTTRLLTLSLSGIGITLITYHFGKIESYKYLKNMVRNEIKIS